MSGRGEIFWMAAKHDGECAECEGDIRKGDEMLWDADDYKAYCETCGEDILAKDKEPYDGF